MRLSRKRQGSNIEFRSCLETLLKWFGKTMIFVWLVFQPFVACAETNAGPVRLAWFREAKFGLFIHWGLYSVPAGQWGRKTTYHEWIQLQTGMPNSDYEKLADAFNPKEFDALSSLLG